MASTTIGPRIVQVLEFASARAPELHALHELASHEQMLVPADVKLDSQRNQRRRRANAFKSHRMPQRLRQKQQQQQLKQSHEEELIALQGRGTSPLATQRHEPVTADEKQRKAEKQRCRKHERRPHKLLTARSWPTAPRASGASSVDGDESGSGEKQKAVWLATHLWHSKRMAMVEKYGMALPAHRADKSVSASLEALRSKATLHDMSYYGILELYGLPQLILEALQLVSDPAGSDFHGMRFLSGGEEGQSVLHHEGHFPAGAICPVTFLWRPLQEDTRSGGNTDGGNKFALHAAWQEKKRQLWLWVHPAAFMEAASAIASACESVAEADGGSGDSAIQVIDRRGQLCRFKLRGALADDFLEQVCVNQDPSSQPTAEDRSGGGFEAESDHDDGFSAVETVEQCAGANLTSLVTRLSSKKKRQRQEKKSRKSAAEPSRAASSSPGVLYSVAVSDPRLRRHSDRRSKSSRPIPDSLTLLREPSSSALASEAGDIRCPLSSESLALPGPKDAEEPESELILKRLSAMLRWTSTPSAASSDASAVLARYPFASPLDGELQSKPTKKSEDVEMATEEVSKSLIPCSYLWSHSKRQQLSRAFEKDHLLNDECFQARQDRTQQPARDSSQVHMIAIEKPGAFANTSGWDLFVPPSFAPALLKAFVFAGALVVGLDEDEALDTVLQRPSFPRDFPDTEAGESYWKAEASALAAAYLKKPKAKRFSYEKHGIASPFQPDWKQLFPAADISEAAAGDEDDEETDSSPCVLRGEEYMTPFCFYKPTDASVAKIPVAVPTLVRVVLRVPGRASLAPNAMLYVPTADDVRRFYSDKAWNGCEITDIKAPERSLLGFVTSAVYDRPKGAFRATGFCACEPLQDAFLLQRELLKSREALAMLRSPRSKMYRPVFIRAEA